MKKSKEYRTYDLFNETFKDIALCLGGIFLIHKTKDRVIWEIANSLEDIYYRSMAELGEIYKTDFIFNHYEDKDILRPHPTIEGLLRVLNLKSGARR